MSEKPPKTRAAIYRQNEDGERPLTPQQQIFVNYLVRDNLTPLAAARMAGYASPEIQITQLMDNPRIAKAISKGRKEFAITTGMTRQKVLDGFLEAIDIAKQAGEAAPMVSGWREIAKMCGYYEPTRHELKVTHEGEVIVAKLQTMSDESLLKLAEGIEIDGEFKKLE